MESEDTVLDEDMIDEICSDEEEEIWELEAEIESLEDELEEAQETLDDVKLIVKMAIDELNEIKDEIEESYFYEEAPSDETRRCYREARQNTSCHSLSLANIIYIFYCYSSLVICMPFMERVRDLDKAVELIRKAIEDNLNITVWDIDIEELDSERGIYKIYAKLSPSKFEIDFLSLRYIYNDLEEPLALDPDDLRVMVTKDGDLELVVKVYGVFKV